MSCRLLASHMTSLDPETFAANPAETFLTESNGVLYQIARNLCFQIGVEDDDQSDELTALIVKSLTWIIRAMKHYPNLCFSDKDEAEGREPVHWVITRLSNIARSKGTKRRKAVFKCFAAFVQFGENVVFDYLELMLEPLHRSESETRNELESTLTAMVRPANDHVSEESQLAKDVLYLLEERCPSQEVFLKAYAAVKTRARDKREKRKLVIRTEAVVDQSNAAMRRINKQEREKKRRKRRANEQRLGRGATAKHRQHF